MVTSIKSEIIVPLIDARRGYVYASIFDKDYNKIMEECYIKLEELKEKVNSLNKKAIYVSLDEFDLADVFEGATWFHVSGISLALNERVAEVALECCKYCHEHNIKVSFDFNYRAKLWTMEEAKPWYQRIIKYVDVAFCSFWDCNTLLDIPLDEGLENASMHEKRQNVCPKMMKKYGVTYVFGTDRVVYSATENSLAGYYYTQTTCKLTDPIKFMIFDRIGGGDAFASGVIHGLLKNFNDPDFAVNWGLNTSVLKHTIYGDACLLSCEDIEDFMKTNGHAEVQR
jgi:2-dehydro-3-deoxygluconokinase